MLQLSQVVLQGLGEHGVGLSPYKPLVELRGSSFTRVGKPVDGAATGSLREAESNALPALRRS